MQLRQNSFRDDMPHKLNDDRRHKFAKAKSRVTNWPDYDAALVRRGDLTVWLTEEAVAAWHAPLSSKRDGQPIYYSFTARPPDLHRFPLATRA